MVFWRSSADCAWVRDTSPFFATRWMRPWYETSEMIATRSRAIVRTRRLRTRRVSQTSGSNGREEGGCAVTALAALHPSQVVRSRAIVAGQEVDGAELRLGRVDCKG